jgi:hypothetical protein
MLTFGFTFIFSTYYPAYKENYILPFITAIFVSFLFYYRYVYYYNNILKNSFTWMPVKAKVVSRKISSHLVFRDRKGGFLPSIEYNYEIDGTFYSSQQFTLFPSIILMHKEEDAKKLMYDLTKSKEITVYVDPEDHHNSFVYNGDAKKIHNVYLPYMIVIIWFPLISPILYFYFTS